MREVSIEYDGCRPIANWTPMLGDFVIYHGWFFNHWYGYVCGISKQEYKIQVFKAGIPLNLLTMTPHEIPSKTIAIPIHKITASRWGAYAIQRLERDRIIWFA